MHNETDYRRLTKSRTDRMIDGVCGGVAEHFHLDPTLVRIAWVLLVIFGGAGVLLYIAAMIIMPAGPLPAPAAGAPVTPPTPRETNTRFWGILLVVVGAVWLADNIGLPVWHHWWRLSFDIALPLILILAGVMFLYGGRNSLTPPVAAGSGDPVPPVDAQVPPVTMPMPTRVYRARSERKFMGVCGGFAHYLNVDPTIVRLVFVLTVFGSAGIAIVAYLLMALIIPEEPLTMPQH